MRGTALCRARLRPVSRSPSSCGPRFFPLETARNLSTSAIAGPAQSTSMIAAQRSAKAARKWFLARTAQQPRGRQVDAVRGEERRLWAGPQWVVTMTAMPPASSTALTPRSTVRPCCIGPLLAGAARPPEGARPCRPRSRSGCARTLAADGHAAGHDHCPARAPLGGQPEERRGRHLRACASCSTRAATGTPRRRR